jgi:hypothetical protein
MLSGAVASSAAPAATAAGAASGAAARAPAASALGKDEPKTVRESCWRSRAGEKPQKWCAPIGSIVPGQGSEEARRARRGSNVAGDGGARARGNSRFCVRSPNEGSVVVFRLPNEGTFSQILSELTGKLLLLYVERKSEILRPNF